MVQVTEAFSALNPENVTLYYTTDPQLANLPILVFHGASTTSNSTLNSSRIQIHVFSAAGFQSYPRLTISPNSPFYNAVNQLPRDEQGDEICRGLAFGLLKYFKELPEVLKTALIVQSAHSRNGRRPGSAPTLFGEQHAANLASAMVMVENITDVIQDVERALQSQSISHIDVDLVLPPGSVSPLKEELGDGIDDEDDVDSFDPSLNQYGSYASLLKLFGQPSFLPTSKLRRAPSKPTSLGRTRSFLKEQKLSLRREMGELVDTEERYVIKMHELVNHIADDFRTKAKTRAAGSFSPSSQDLQKLFPASLDVILQVNSGFLADIRKVMDETEEDAMQDLEADQVNFTRSRHGGTGRLKDPTGAVAFAKVLLNWFPRFSNCYQDYIRSSQEFPLIITTFVREQSSFSRRVQKTGEQRLRSAVIEPVQRLPRYSLFIDNIVNYLPLTHPALQPILKARDIITAICSLDPPATEKSSVVNRLRNLVEAWPSTLLPQGRLISAADYVELAPPYQPASSSPTNSGILLLFADSIIVLRKSRGSILSARGILAEIDKPSAANLMASVTAAAGGQKNVYETSFLGWHMLGDTRFTESSDGCIAWMTSLHDLKDEGTGRNRNCSAGTMRAFVLQGAYDGKASKWSEEVIKARVEGRFSEKERETDKWCLRNINLKDIGLNVYTAVFEEGIDQLIEGRKEPAPIRIVVDHSKGTKGAPVGHYGVETVANVTVSQGNAGLTYHLEIDGLNDKVYLDAVDSTTFMPVFAKRVSDLLYTQHAPSNPALTAAFISHYSQILKALNIQLEGDKVKSYRPPSPVKILSSLLNGGGSFSGTSGSLKHPRTPLLGNIPAMAPPGMGRSDSQRSIDYTSESKHLAPPINNEPQHGNPLVKLEETFTSYITALQSRKGNVVGKLLRMRASSDELSVNAIYNAFIENPFDTRTSSEVTIDVLFSAFEKFLRMAWKDQMGPVVTLPVLEALQEKAAKLFPGDFADFVRAIFGDLTPQNKRAFVAIVKLLTDLLDGCGNDGDRGALTAAFAELLITEGDPHNFINLLDRMVEDSDRLFDDFAIGGSTGYTTPAYGSISSTTRSMRSTNTGSLTSNTSSLRKRFGFDTLLRQNSKSGNDSRPSMWRTLSKTDRNTATSESTTSSLSKASMHRSRSIDVDSRLGTPRSRPTSRDRPSVLGAFEDRPTSSHTQTRLSTIGASPPPEPTETMKSLKKKRRSSLSDLKALMASTNLDSPLSSPQSRRPQSQLPPKFNLSPGTPSPTKDLSSQSAAMNLDLPQQKENTLLGFRNVGSLTERPQNVMTDDSVVIKDLWSVGKGHLKTASVSNIPTLKGALRERTPTSTPTKSTSSPQKASPQKLRLQSPQKLRERLQHEAKAIGEAEASLQSELSKIGEEMARLNSGSSGRANSADLRRLGDSVRALESKIPVVIRDLTGQNDTIKADLETSLQASEYKVKGLDQLYKEASAENELLYEKFNGELGKIVKALRSKNKEDKEELVSKMKEAVEETAKTKKENARLRRELLTMRTLLKGNESAS